MIPEEAIKHFKTSGKHEFKRLWTHFIEIYCMKNGRVTVIRLFTIGLVTVPIKVFSRNLHPHIFILHALNLIFQCSDSRDRNDF